MKKQPAGKRRGISRREMVQKLVGGASSGLLAANIAVARPADAQAVVAASPAASPATTVKATANGSALLFLDSHQSGTLTALAERIVPGATKAGVTPFVDLLLSVDTMENRESFVASLSAMDGEALRRFGVPFQDLPEARQIELLTVVSTAAQPPSSRHENRSAEGENATATRAELPLSVLRDHFENLKAWTSKAYYSSEVGMKELGWKDQYFYETFSE